MSRVFSEIIRNNRGFVEIVSFTEKISSQNGFFHQKENETQKNQEPPEQLLTIKSKNTSISASVRIVSVAEMSGGKFPTGIFHDF